MSWDIYGEPLRRGHCEVHPHVHEEYPCSVCIADKQANDQQGMCRGGCESEHLLGLAREHIKELEQERDALADHVEEAKSTIGEWRSGAFGDTAAAMSLEAWRASCPETSLVRRDLLKQAEVLEESARAFKAVPLKVECGRWFHVATEMLERKAAKLRRQAEGGE